MQAQRAETGRWVPFAYGFRPFFLAALAYAPVAVLAWLSLRATGWLPFESVPPQLWHGHEMIFGFAGAAIAGFMLTAVPSWTGQRGFGGATLVLLASLWLGGRLAFAASAWLPAQVLMVAELVFLPALVASLAPPLLRARNRHTVLLAVLAVLWSIDALFMRAVMRGDALLASRTLYVAIDIVLLLITVIGGRIVPAFTGNALRRRGVEVTIRSRGWLETVVIVAMALVVMGDAFEFPLPVKAVVAAGAAIAHALRLSGWQGLRTLREPIVWVLHFAYAWLPVGLALKATYLATGAPWAMPWLHALTMGGIAMMIVAVITRASLGHTGRELVVTRTTSVAYAVLTAAVLLRLLGAALPGPYELALRASGALWVAAFLLVLLVYAPILLRPRADGKPG